MKLPEASLPNGAPINALDARGLADLQRQSKGNDPTAIKAAAKQFEALFLQMVLKSMREATPRTGLFDNEQSKMYESLLDQQLSQVLTSKNGMGLAAVIERQMMRQMQTSLGGEDGESLPGPLPRFLPLEKGAGATGATGAASPAPSFNNPALAADWNAFAAPPQRAREFVNRVLPDAEAASRETGIPALFLVAHAALETGWGKSEPRGADGRVSNNLFGIKAGRSWSGDSVESATVEYVQGVPQRRVERFRAYGSTADAFRDYANLLTTQPRYAQVVGIQDSQAFADGLQRAGYATDPHYAQKLTRVINSLKATI